MTMAHRVSPLDHIEAHKHSSHNRAELEWSNICGCFSCTAVFPPSAIVEWTDQGETALCPSCTMDAVIGSQSGYPITIGALEKMRAHWF
jgi:hypothetical protein